MQNLKLTMKKSMQFIASSAIIFGLVACDKSKNSDPQPVTNVYQNCLNCYGIQGQNFFRSISTSQNQNIILNLNFFGQNNFQPYYSYTGSPVVSYFGPVAVQGTMRVNVMANINGAGSGCLIPAGDYNLQTIQAGQWSAALFNQVRLLATGPTTLYLKISTGQVTAKRYNDMGKLWTEIPQEGQVFADVVVESVAGLQCMQSFLVQ